MSDPAGQKALLRKELLKKRGALSETEHAHLSDALGERLERFVRDIGAKRILAFYPVGSEFDLKRFYQSCLCAGIDLFFPRCAENGIVFYRVENSSLSSGLVPGPFGIPEPPETFERYRPRPGDLCVAPCLAADRRGYRIGYGKGYYDRFLSSPAAPRSVCAVPERFLLPDLPHTGNDVCVKYLVTERRVLSIP